MARSRQKPGSAETLERLVLQDGNTTRWLRKTGLARWALALTLLAGPALADAPRPAPANGIAPVTGIALPGTKTYNFSPARQMLQARARQRRTANDETSGQVIVVKAPEEDEDPARADATRAEPAGNETDGAPAAIDAKASRGGAGEAANTMTVADEAIEVRDEDDKAALTPGPPADPALDPQTGAPLYLEVLINGFPTNLIAEFVQLPDGRFAARAKELDELGIRVPDTVAADELVRLEELGAKTRYDEAQQRLNIEIGVDRLKKHVIDLAAANRKKPQLSPSGIGFVLNYGLFASARAEKKFTRNTFEGVSANLEGWIYSPYGTLFSSGIVKAENFAGNGKTRLRSRAIRLDSHWTFVDLERAVTWKVGDIITSGPGWARPVRLGGVKVSRSFRLRPDIITVPLPSLSGTAAVPTTIDVYVNNLKVHSGQVEPGPLEITNIPAIAPGGVARLVMRDAAGREIVREQSFVVSPKLMREGLMEFSVAAGVPRDNYGMKSFDYAWKHPGVSGSVRHGLSHSLTVEGHAEAARNMIMGGGGLVFSLFDRAIVSTSAAVSHSKAGTGYLSHVTLETHFRGFSVNASSLRTWGDFVDLAGLDSARVASGQGGVITGMATYPKAVESLSIGYALSDWHASVAASLVHAKPRVGEASTTVNLSYHQGLWGKASLYLTSVIDIDDPKHPSIFAGFNMPLGGRKSLSAGGSYDEEGRYRANLSVQKSLGLKENSVGWRARVSYGDLKSLSASLAWRAPVMTVRGNVTQIGEGTSGNLSIDGALVVADGAIFASNRIMDAFAVVNAGAPGVRVRYENREVGRTRGDGRLLVTQLRSLERNKISIDPETMPVDAVVENDKTYVVPGVRAGVVVNFKTKRTTDAALVILHDVNGKPLAPGAEVRLEGREEVFMVGYDGETYLEGLKEHNRVSVSTDTGECHASFTFRPGKEVQPVIGPVTCAP